MAPNICEVAEIDKPAVIYLMAPVLGIDREVLKPSVSASKVFQGERFDTYVKDAGRSFTQMVIRKIDAPRAKFQKLYVIDKGHRG